jgi:uncharacterized protein DUF4439
MSASPSPPAAGSSAAATRAAVAALQAALRAEHAAVFGYAVAGAHLAGARRAAAGRYWTAHETARDTLTAMVTALGGQPVPAAGSYALPFGVHGAQSAVALAAYMEDRVAAAYLGLVALADIRLRGLGARAVQSAALRAAGWRDRAVAFPGLDVPGG